MQDLVLEAWLRLIILMFGCALLVAYVRKKTMDNLVEAVLFILLGSILFVIEATGIMVGDTNWWYFLVLHVPVYAGLTGLWFLSKIRLGNGKYFMYGIALLGGAMVSLIYGFADSTIPAGQYFTDPYYIYVLGSGFIGFVAIIWLVWTDFMKRKANYNLLFYTTIYVVIGIIVIVSGVALQYAA
jgi:hypothetical protein